MSAPTVGLDEATTAYEPIGQVLTAEEYDALPEDPRRELVDGEIHVMSPPTMLHQLVRRGMENELVALCQEQLAVTSEVEIKLAPLRRRIPDVLVLHAEHYDAATSQLRPDQLVLVVEVVSPGSESRDREVKPREYARAGIPHYWRVEITPRLEVHTFRLGDAGYLETGVWSAGDTVKAPGLWWAQVVVDHLSQRRPAR